MSRDRQNPFQKPVKRILSKEHLEAFKASPTYLDILGFVDDLNQAVVGEKLTDGAGSTVRILAWQSLNTAHEGPTRDPGPCAGDSQKHTPDRQSSITIRKPCIQDILQSTEGGEGSF